MGLLVSGQLSFLGHPLLGITAFIVLCGFYHTYQVPNLMVPT